MSSLAIPPSGQSHMTLSRVRRPHPSQAFTLLELLVVVAIIALLIALLMPALGKVREHARAVVCMSHLHEIHTAFQGFAASNKGRIVCATSGTWLDPDSNTVELGTMYW